MINQLIQAQFDAYPPYVKRNISFFRLKCTFNENMGTSIYEPCLHTEINAPRPTFLIVAISFQMDKERPRLGKTSNSRHRYFTWWMIPWRTVNRGMHLNTNLTAGIPQDPSNNCNALCCPSKGVVHMTPRLKGRYAVPESLNCQVQTGQVNKLHIWITEDIKRRA